MSIDNAIQKISMYNRFGSKLGLERMEKLLSLIGNPQDNLKVIHVAGTNGKGSVCRYVYSVLKECGYRTGLFTSPYLERFTERIEINGQEIDGTDLEQITNLVIQKADEMIALGLDSPTEFEIVTAIALYYYNQQKTDFVVLEVGLGGRGDSTNIIKNSLVSAIVTISFDHTDCLGETIREIAWEKAGIIKPRGVLVSTVSDIDAKLTIEKVCKEKDAVFYDFSDIKYKISKTDIYGSTFSTTIGEIDFKDITISMAGEHQIQNAVCALGIIKVLREKYSILIDDEKLHLGIKKAKQTGRIEIIKENPLMIIDGAHNIDSVKALSNVISKYIPQKRILLVTGMLKDKDVNGISEILAALATNIIVTEPDNPRKLQAEKLAVVFEKFKSKSNVKIISDCISAADYVAEEIELRGNPEKYDLILFTGSLYLIGKIRRYFGGERNVRS